MAPPLASVRSSNNLVQSLAVTRAVPHDFWFRADVCGDLGRFDLRAALSKITVLPGWTQDDLAQLLGYSRPTLNKIVNGGRPLRLDEALAIIRTLDIPSFLVGVSDNRALTAGISRSHPDIQRIAAQVRADTAEHAALEREHGGNSLAPVLARRLSVVLPTARNIGAPPVTAAAAELSALAGYAYYDAQDYRLSSHYYDVALQAAHESGVQVMVPQIRALMSMRATWLERSNEAVAHCAIALDYPGIGDSTRSMLLVRRARAEALQGNGNRVRRLLDASRGLQGTSTALSAPIAYWSDMQMHGNIGIAYKDIREFDLAEQNLRDAVALGDRANSRDTVLYLGMLSRLYVKTNRLDEAARTAMRILDSHVVSNRARTQLSLFMTKTNHLDGLALRGARSMIREFMKTQRG